MKLYFAAVMVLLPTLSLAQSDPFEPDDNLPFFGAAMDGGRPDFTEPSNNYLGRIDGWRIEGRQLDGSGDLDWMIFNEADLPYCELDGELRVIAEDNFSEANLRVEVLGFRQGSVLDSSPTPRVLQSCNQAPTGSSVIALSLTTNDFSAFYRLRSCNNLNGLRYRFEYRSLESRFCVASGTIAGSVLDARNGDAIKGAYVFSDLNDATFSSPANGEFNIIATNASSVVLDFFAGGITSAGAVNVGPVDAFDRIEGVTLWGQPTGLIFYSGFE